MLKSVKTVVSTSKGVFLGVFTVSLSPQAISLSVFPPCLSLSSFCVESGENSEKSHHMLSATSHIELEFFTKLLNMSKFENWLIFLYQRVPLQDVGKLGEVGSFPDWCQIFSCFQIEPNTALGSNVHRAKKTLNFASKMK